MFWKCALPEIENILGEIKPKAFFKLLGNHDEWLRGDKHLSRYFTLVGDYLEAKIENNGETYNVCLSHYPMISWNGKPRGSLMLHGHCHGNIDEFNEESRDLRVDLGFSSEIAKQSGSFLIPFEDIISWFRSTMDPSMSFKEYVMNNCDNL